MQWVHGFSSSFVHLIAEYISWTAAFPGMNWQIPIQFSEGIDLSQIHWFLSRFRSATYFSSPSSLSTPYLSTNILQREKLEFQRYLWVLRNEVTWISNERRFLCCYLLFALLPCSYQLLMHLLCNHKLEMATQINTRRHTMGGTCVYRNPACLQEEKWDFEAVSVHHSSITDLDLA